MSNYHRCDYCESNTMTTQKTYYSGGVCRKRRCTECGREAETIEVDRSELDYLKQIKATCTTLSNMIDSNLYPQK